MLRLGSSLALFAWLISHQPAVLSFHNKSATSNQPTVLFSQNKPAPAISHQPTEQADLVQFPGTFAPTWTLTFCPKGQNIFFFCTSISQLCER
jgi:hypothetical protein